MIAENEEWVPLVDENGNVTGKALRSTVHNGSRLLHPVVHMHILNDNKDMLLQKRPLSKLIQPGKWDTAVGGHISSGESPAEALKKEAYEEMGLVNFSAVFHKLYIWESNVEAELVYLFSTTDYQSNHVHSDEIDEARFWKPDEIESCLGENVFTPNFEHEFRLLKEMGVLSSAGPA
jgi:isopentenyldiphosphate isomerase